MCIRDRANGRPEFNMPSSSNLCRCRNKSDHKPRNNSRGSKNTAATATRTPAVGSAPNSAAPKRMNKNDAPHSADSKINSTSQGLCV